MSTPEMERPSHWDLMLEQPGQSSSAASDDGLLTFEVLVPPDQWGPPTKVRQLQNHRRLYLDYEGPISNNRGTVTRVLEGEFRWRLQTISLIEVELVGDTSDLQGVLVIKKLEGIEGNRWEMQMPPR